MNEEHCEYGHTLQPRKLSDPIGRRICQTCHPKKPVAFKRKKAPHYTAVQDAEAKAAEALRRETECKHGHLKEEHEQLNKNTLKFYCGRCQTLANRKALAKYKEKKIAIQKLEVRKMFGLD